MNAEAKKVPRFPTKLYEGQGSKSSANSKVWNAPIIIQYRTHYRRLTFLTHKKNTLECKFIPTVHLFFPCINPQTRVTRVISQPCPRRAYMKIRNSIELLETPSTYRALTLEGQIFFLVGGRSLSHRSRRYVHRSGASPGGSGAGRRWAAGR